MARIELTNVNLSYPLRVHHGLTLKEYLLKKFFGRETPIRREVHALRDLSLQIGVGERVGIIGHNGAGKTTLLRTMAGIYPISSGTCEVHGKICSLLDIGAGMEPEANGWENIRYRGYLQGETPNSLKEKMAEIAEFTELGSFMDLPIRCYSTGMTMRLAFAIATSSKPEILFVDEVFATGDLAFQNKAEKRMKLLMKEAKIVVMVGHNLQFLEEFCDRAIWLEQGQIRADGPAHQVIRAYRDNTSTTAQAA
jgi:ABC-type polysaccharide/polyol phosphate transport system ATPase subunit